jgi:peptidoglycan hydrolase-like protein with peptidoglycan-binding domain
MKITSNAGMSIMFATLLSIGLTSSALAYYPIQSQLDFGETNADVTNLQTFFKDNPAIYPEGIVSGYFGSLTRSSVQRFQAQYGLDQVGRVGPMTQSKINSLIASGGWTVSDISGPSISSVSKSVSNTSVTFGWNTDELASAKVFYNTSPVSMSEGDITSSGFGSTNGWTSANDSIARTSQQVTVSGLHPNTQYYYVIVATDVKGNVSVWNPNMTVATNQ